MTLTVAFDSETERFRPGCMSPPVVCGSYASGRASGISTTDDYLDHLERWLRNPLIILVGASTSYDLACAAAARPHLLPLIFAAYDAGRIRDVLIRQKLIDIAMGAYRGYADDNGDWHNLRYNLKAVAERLTDLVLEKEGSPRLEYGRLSGLPLSAYSPAEIDYAKLDAVAPLAVYNAQAEGVAEQDASEVLGDEPAQCRADFALKLASVWGITTDAEGVEILRELCETALTRLRPDLEAAGFIVLTTRGKDKGKWKRKTRVVAAAVLDAAGGDMKDVRLTKKGKEVLDKGGDWQQIKYISIDAEACADSNDPLLDAYGEYSKTSNLLVGHVKAMLKGVYEPIHTYFDVLMETGRTSSSGPNIQNVRRAEGARECFKPRPGQAFVACDYGSAELHTAAQICYDLFGESTLGDALNNGIDAHLLLGSRLLGIDYDEAKALHDADDENMAHYRTTAKPANFGFLGGMGHKSMVKYAKATYGVILTEHESRQLKTGWENTWPVESQQYLGEYIRNLTAMGDALVIHHRSKRWRGQCRYTVAANTHFQGLAADAAKAALYQVAKLCYTHGNALSGCRVVNFIHDEILIEAPLERVTEAALLLQKTMVEVFNTYTPDCHVSADPVAMNRWSKKARPLWVAGELKVWEYER